MNRELLLYGLQWGLTTTHGVMGISKMARQKPLLITSFILNTAAALWSVAYHADRYGEVTGVLIGLTTFVLTVVVPGLFLTPMIDTACDLLRAGVKCGPYTRGVLAVVFLTVLFGIQYGVHLLVLRYVAPDADGKAGSGGGSSSVLTGSFSGSADKPSV